MLIPVKKTLIKAAFVSLFLIANNAFCANQTNAVNELISLLNKTNSMQASFEQHQLNEKGIKIEEKTTGIMMFERPGKFIWHVKKPAEQLSVVNKEKSYLYDVDLEQATVRKTEQNPSNNPTIFLSSPENKIAGSFTITKINPSGKKLQFQLTPKTKDAQKAAYKWIRISFTKNKLSNLQILNNFGQKSDISFSNIKINPKFSSKTFDFTPPKGVDVFKIN